MGQTNNPAFTRHQSIIVLLALSFLILQPAVAADNVIEDTRLATLVRQLDMLNRMAEQTATLQRQDDSRYHFDYTRLREDIARVRNGIHDYLTPPRAQPRDPMELTGDYGQESENAP